MSQNDTETDDTHRLFRAFVAGFKCSREGYNAEYPFNFDNEEIQDALRDDFEEWYESTDTEQSS